MYDLTFFLFATTISKLRADQRVIEIYVLGFFLPIVTSQSVFVAQCRYDYCLTDDSGRLVTFNAAKRIDVN